MSDRFIVIVRWMLLAFAAHSVLLATLLHRGTRRRLLEPWIAATERAGGKVPSWAQDPRVQRGWGLFMATFFLGLWWYLGTVEGVEAARRLLRG